MEKLEEASREARRSSWAESKAIIMVEEEEASLLPVRLRYYPKTKIIGRSHEKNGFFSMVW